MSTVRYKAFFSRRFLIDMPSSALYTVLEITIVEKITIDKTTIDKTTIDDSTVDRCTAILPIQRAR